MFNAVLNPVVIGIIVLVLLILIVVPVLIRRRRAAQGQVLPPPELGQAVDYTSMPYEEPTTFVERLRQAPIGVKLLLGLVPLVVIIAGVVLWLTLSSQPPEVLTPPPPAPVISAVNATLASPSRIVVEADTNMPDGTEVTASMKEGDQELAWFNPDSAKSTVSAGKISLVMERSRTAPAPKRGQDQIIILNARANGQAVTSDPVKLVVPAIHAKEFFRDAPVAAAPTTAPTPTTAASTPAPTSTPAPATPEVTSTPALQATVFNGGNIRRQPKVTNDKADVLGQLHAGEVVTLLERSDDSAWYRVAAPEAEGWVSATLLTIDPAVAQQVPNGQATPGAAGLSASVFNGGNLRERPVTGKVLDQINANETVQLLAKTSDGAWYKITNIRSITGWVSATLLKIDSETAKKVPVAK